MRHPFNPAFSRRRLLASLGVGAIAAPFIPLLESAAGGEKPPKRFVVFFHPHGTVPHAWQPTGTETEFTLPEILAPLQPFQDRLLVVAGLDVHWSGPPGGPHTTGPGYVFTGSPMMAEPIFKHANSGGPHGWPDGPSVDQVIAQHVGGSTAFRSLEFGVQTGAPFPGSRISYAGPKQPLAPQPDPHYMFERIFGVQGIDPSLAEELAARRRRVIDVITPELAALRPRLGAADKMKIDAHVESLAQLEAAVTATYDCAPPELGPPVEHLLDPAVTDVLSRQQLDLMVAALACGATNVASIMYKKGENDEAPYPWLQIDAPHHSTSHSGDGDVEAQADLVAIYRWYAEELAYFAGRLDAIVEPDGSTLLDNTLIFWGTEIAKGNTHAWSSMPFVLLGGGGGSIDTGRYLQFQGDNHCRLLVALCRAMGLDIDAFGGFDDGTGVLPGVLA